MSTFQKGRKMKRKKEKIKRVRSSFSPKHSYELLRVRISKLEKDVYSLKIKTGLIEPETPGV